MDQVPAASPPPGYTQNLQDPDTKYNVAGIAVSILGMVLMTLFLVLRIYTKAILSRTFGLDDATLILAWLASFALQAMLVHLWATEHIGVHIWDLTVAKVNYTLLISLIAAILYNPMMALAKLTLLLFYRKLSTARWFRVVVYCIMAFQVAYSIAIIAGLILTCKPISSTWDVRTQHGNCKERGRHYVYTAGLNAFTDLIILLLPLPVVVKLKIPTIQKLGLVAMFSIGSLTLVTSLIRLSLLPRVNGSADWPWLTSIPSIWACVEASLVIISCCLPVLRLFFRHVAPSLIGEYASDTPILRRPFVKPQANELVNLQDNESRSTLRRHFDRMKQQHVTVDETQCTTQSSSKTLTTETVTSIDDLEARMPPEPAPSAAPPQAVKQTQLCVPIWYDDANSPTMVHPPGSSDSKKGHVRNFSYPRQDRDGIGARSVSRPGSVVQELEGTSTVGTMLKQ